MSKIRVSGHKRRLLSKQVERETLRDEMRRLQADMDFLRDVLIFKQQQLRCLNQDIACLSRLLPVLSVLPGNDCLRCPHREHEAAKVRSQRHLVCVK